MTLYRCATNNNDSLYDLGSMKAYGFDNCWWVPRWTRKYNTVVSKKGNIEKDFEDL